ncbi:pyridoxal-phosphate dependent enzyme [Stutzerimonas stutzeri]|nr:pyridoxal-phosphate dependent enzyme [Stutzerimonas stutzeri]
MTHFMPYSYLSHLYCPKTDERHDAERIQQLSAVGAPLLVAYDLDGLKRSWRPRDLIGREANLWRYHELLPVRDASNVVSLGEGFTPLFATPRIGRDLGIDDLWLKDEGIIPTGSFKARGAAVVSSASCFIVVIRIEELKVLCPSERSSRDRCGNPKI